MVISNHLCRTRLEISPALISLGIEIDKQLRKRDDTSPASRVVVILYQILLPLQEEWQPYWMHGVFGTLAAPQAATECYKLTTHACADSFCMFLWQIVTRVVIRTEIEVKSYSSLPVFLFICSSSRRSQKDSQINYLGSARLGRYNMKIG